MTATLGTVSAIGGTNVGTSGFGFVNSSDSRSVTIDASATLLLVWVGEYYGDGVNDEVTSVTYGGDALTRLKVTGPGGGASISLWYRVNPKTGANTLAISCSQYRCWVVGIDAIDGADTSTPFRAQTGGDLWKVSNPNPGNPSVTLESATGDLCLDGCVAQVDSGDISQTAGQTATWEAPRTYDGGGHYDKGFGQRAAGAASVTMGWTNVTRTSGQIAVSVVAAASTTPVSKTVTPSWTIKNTRQKTVTPSYNVRAKLTKTYTANYNIALSGTGHALDAFGGGGVPAEGVIVPIEYDFSDVERSFIESQPPGLLPENQDSNFGQIRKVVADEIQRTVDQVNGFLAEIFIASSSQYLSLYEEEYGLPIDPANVTTAERRARLLGRRRYGTFTRDGRQSLVEEFVKAVIGGAALVLWTDGIALSDDGVPLGTDVYSLTGTYSITEDIENFSYTVNVKNTLGVDVTGLERELTRLTPAGISFTVNEVANP